jgi:hypothetical protein
MQNITETRGRKPLKCMLNQQICWEDTQVLGVRISSTDYKFLRDNIKSKKTSISQVVRDAILKFNQDCLNEKAVQKIFETTIKLEETL